jgi:hypothetical protein
MIEVFGTGCSCVTVKQGAMSTMQEPPRMTQKVHEWGAGIRTRPKKATKHKLHKSDCACATL